MNKKIALVLGTLILGITLVACSGGGEKEPETTTTTSATVETTEPTTTGEFSMTVEEWRSNYNEVAGELQLDELMETTDEDGNPAYMGQVSNMVSILVTADGDSGNITSIFFTCSDKAHSNRERLENAVGYSLLALGWDEGQVETARQELSFYNDEKNTTYSLSTIDGTISISKMVDMGDQTVMINLG